ncbi:MAG: Type II secretion system protein F [Verrucomicrobia subdivision 3 bacterium]|nr:Type II secretion system protein F [Limisphaerales bacterium]MCS1413073.1 Type II secretion system protein F [Limisphaerales bacterium]
MIVTPRHLEKRAEFYHQVGTMTRAGLSLIQCLESLSRGRAARSLGQPVARLIERLEAGSTFSESAASIRGWLPAFDLALLDSGERSGRLDICFCLLAEFYRERARAVGEVIRRMMYPILVVHVAVFLGPFPQLFSTGELGPYIRSVGSVLIPIYVVVLAVVYIAQGSHGFFVRSLIERVFAFVPLLGAARRSLALSRLCLALASLLGSGTSMGRSWALAADASGSPRIQKAVGPFEQAIEGGWTPGELLNDLRCFPDLFVSLYQGGESSGRLDENLERLRTHYQEEGFRKLQLFAVWLPQMIYFFIVAVIAYRIVTFWVGYYEGVIDETEF